MFDSRRHVTLSPEQLARIVAQADRDRISVSEFLRLAALTLLRAVDATPTRSIAAVTRAADRQEAMALPGGRVAAQERTVAKAAR